MVLDKKVIETIKHHEGIRFKPYQCPALLWTVGVGHVIDPNHARVLLAERKALPIPSGWDRVLTMGEVDEILVKDLARFESGVRHRRVQSALEVWRGARRPAVRVRRQ